MIKFTKNLIRHRSVPVFLLVVLAWMPLAEAAPFDRSDLNNDNTVDTLDLEVFSNEYLAEGWQEVDWCNFYVSSLSNERYFRKYTSDRIDRFEELLTFIKNSYGCELTLQSTDKSDLNNDSIVDLEDLVIFSANYLGRHWESVDWCLFHDSTLAGVEFEGQSTKYFLKHFTQLLSFINEHFNCGGAEPPADLLALENVPKYLARVADAPYLTGDYYITDPVVGSLFIYDSFLVLKAEIKGLNKPLGVAIDSQGRILVGNNGRDNVEVYDPANGELLAVFGGGLIQMPTAITVDDLGNIYVTDSVSNNIQVYDAAYNPLRTIGRAGLGEGGLNFPVDVEIITGSAGGTANIQEVFVADQGNYRIQVFDIDGNWLRSITYAGECGWFSCTSPPFTRLQALDTDSFGRLHVLDNFAATVMIFDPADGAFLDSYGGFGSDAGLLRVPLDVLISEANMAIVTAGDGGRIETFTIQ